MFTGLISGVGMLRSRDDGVFVVATPYDPSTIALGASIAFDGCCLTATEMTSTDKGCAIKLDVSNETLAHTILGDWNVGTRINLERSLRMGDELGGHIVSGHVDGVATIKERTDDGNAVRLTFETPDHLAPYVAKKGSVALNGTSLTVNGVSGTLFDVALIPHTCAVTTWGEAKVGDRVNIEVDVLARYVARQGEFPGFGSPE